MKCAVCLKAREVYWLNQSENLCINLFNSTYIFITKTLFMFVRGEFWLKSKTLFITVDEQIH